MPPTRTSLRAPLLFLAAATVRAAVLATTFDVPGDGPSRAVAAFEWARSPSFPTWGVWPPGFLFLSGLVAVVVPDPRVAARLANLLLGSVTVPVLYLLARRLYGETVALASAGVLCLLPLHVGLSASSLSEPAFVLELVAALLLLAGDPSEEPHAAPARRRVAAGALCLVLASMTRYEAWPLLPLFVLHRLWRSRSVRGSAIFAAALVAFPVFWTAGNYLHTGDALLGFTAATSYIGIPPTPASPAHALVLLSAWSVAQLGLLLPVAIVAGAAGELARAARGRLGHGRVLFLAVVAMQWLVLLRFTMVRGENVWTRYLIGGLVCALPLAFAPLAGRAEPGRAAAPSGRRAGALAAAAILGVYLPWLVRPGQAAANWVTARRPVAVEAMVDWLRGSGRVTEPMLLTPMGWDATYVALDAPEVAQSSLIFSEWIDERALDGWIRSRRPQLLVTSAGDEAFAATIQQALGYPLAEATELFRFGPLRVLDLSRATVPGRLPAS